MLKTLFMCFSLLAGTPQPAENYHSWISPEISDIIIDKVISEEYHEHLDFNGDGELTIADAVGVRKRYEDNCTYGNEITLDEEIITDIAWENFTTERMEREDFVDNLMFYYEIDFVNKKPCRQYELTVSEITTANIYYEFADDTMGNVTVEINPFEETVRVMD
jgi:hypothetical protein